MIGKCSRASRTMIASSDNAPRPVGPQSGTPQPCQAPSKRVLLTGTRSAESIMASGHARVPHQQAEHMAAPISRVSPIKISLPTGGRPHMARFSRTDPRRERPLPGVVRTSASERRLYLRPTGANPKPETFAAAMAAALRNAIVKRFQRIRPNKANPSSSDSRILRNSRSSIRPNRRPPRSTPTR